MRLPVRMGHIHGVLNQKVSQVVASTVFQRSAFARVRRRALGLQCGAGAAEDTRCVVRVAVFGLRAVVRLPPQACFAVQAQTRALTFEPHFARRAARVVGHMVSSGDCRQTGPGDRRRTRKSSARCTSPKNFFFFFFLKYIYLLVQRIAHYTLMSQWRSQ